MYYNKCNASELLKKIIKYFAQFHLKEIQNDFFQVSYGEQGDSWKKSSSGALWLDSLGKNK